MDYRFLLIFNVGISCLFLAFILLFAIGSAIMMMRLILKKKRNQNQRQIVLWLSLLILFLLITMSGNLMILIDFFTGTEFADFYELNILLGLSALGFTGLVISPFFFPHLSYSIQKERSSVSKHEDHPSAENCQNDHPLHLDSGYLVFIEEKTDTCMKELMPYLKKDFNLVQLSTMIHIPLHHLSCYFRECRKQSFNDYKNQWRIRYAKKLITEGHADKVTLETIGHLSGFVSRNTFFISFKKEEGVSPSTFLSTKTSLKSK